MKRWCAWHDGEVPEDEATEVGAQEPGSGPGRPAYACRGCVSTYGLLPLDLHPAGATGAPIGVNPAYIGRRNAAPIPPGGQA
jgi:hypothetical protein